MNNILYAFILFASLGLFLGLVLALFSKIFAVKTNPKVEKIAELLPGANCSGCGYTSCHALAEAIENGVAKTNACRVCDAETVSKISEIMGVDPEKTVRMRAQVMCTGTFDKARAKYVYEGPRDCAAAAKLGGGNKACLNGCIGFGTCVSKCNFGAISVIDGVAQIDYAKCMGCGTCVAACPKHIIKLIPYDAAYWVGCMSVDNGRTTMRNCDAGCIGCRICEKNCKTGAITIHDGVAAIDYGKCVGCGVCVINCPRKIIHTGNLHHHVRVLTDMALDERENTKR